MKKAKILIAFALFFVLILSVFIFKPKTEAYSSTTTHPLLTQKIAELYNYIYDPDLTNEQIQSLMAGSTDEDTPPRWINHFYDPTTGLGWLGKRLGDISQTTVMTAAMLAFGKEPISAVNWTQNQELQNNQYSLYQGNRTFDSAVLYYSEGKKQEAYYSLGYILHLVEDMTVPAHTRQDTHFDMAPEIFEQILGVKLDKGEPYEKWAEQYGNIAPNLMDDLKKNYQPICSSLESCLIYLANYSNNNFFSEDSILDEEYKLPIASNYVYKDKYIYIYSKENILLSRAKIEDKTNILYDKTTNLSEIQQSYWNRLSPAAVLAGVEVVKYFHEQVEKAKNNEITIERPEKISFWKKATTVSLWGEIARLWKLTSLAATNPFSLWYDDNQQDESQVESQSPNLLTDVGLTYEEAQERMDDLQELLDLLNNKEEGSPFDLPSFELPSLPRIEPPSLGLPTLGLPTLELPPLLQPPEQDQPQTPPVVAYTDSSGANRTIYPKILISEIQIAGLNDEKEEFVELYNPNNENINLTGWYLHRKTETGSSYSTFAKKDLFSGKIIKAKDYFLISRQESSFAVLGGIVIDNSLGNDGSSSTLALKNPNGEISDKLGFGQAQDYELIPAIKPEKGKSLGRKWVNNTEQDTDNNYTDFEIQNPTPKAKNVSFTPSPPTPSPTPTPPPPPATPAKIILITEVQIEGEKANNDFIELYNPSNQQIDISGYQLKKKNKAGTESSIKVLPGGSIVQPKSYFLWANSETDYNYTLQADVASTSYLTENNSIVLLDKDKNIINALAWGEGHNNPFVETTPFPQNPPKNQSLARKLVGENYQDKNDNSADFEIQTPTPKAKNQQHEEPLPTDAMPPSVISDLTAVPGDNRGEIKLSWTAPSDDSGTVTEYQIKYSSQEIDEDNWVSAADISAQLPAPKEFGAQENIIISGLTPGAAYYFAIKSKDEAGNVSQISNSDSVEANAIADHLVINEIQLGKREFVELYNPTTEDINLSSYYFSYFSYSDECATNPLKCHDWNDPDHNKPFSEGDSIISKGFYLIGLNEFTTSQGADWQINNPFHLNNEHGAVVIFPFNPEEKLPEEAKAGYIDAVAWGKDLTGMLVKEGEPVNPVPGAEKSMERKIKGWDTDDNKSDFVILDTPTPKSGPPITTIWDATVYPTCGGSSSPGAVYYYLLIKWQSPNPDLDFYQAQYKLNDSEWQDLFDQTTTTETEKTFRANYSLFNDNIYYFRARGQDKEGNIGEWVQIEVDLTIPVVINEVAVGGTKASPWSDQWIELYNRSDKAINLTGWKIVAGDATFTDIDLFLEGEIPANGYFLLERNDDLTVSDTPANQVFTSWGGVGRGSLSLSDEKGRKIDEFYIPMGGWREDDVVRDGNYYSIERISPVSFGFDWRNWKVNNGEIKNGLDRGGNDIYGTPGQQNSNYLLYTTYYLDFVEDTVLKKEYNPYLIRGISTVFENTTLTIEPGVVMKFYGEYVNSAFGGLFIQGTLKAIGTTEEPIIFTSYYDDEYSGDTNNDGNTTPPGPGYWLGLNFKESSKGSELENIVVRYGGAFFGITVPYSWGAAMIVEQTDISLKNSVIEKNLNKGLWLVNSNSIIDSVDFLEHKSQIYSPESEGRALLIDGGSPTIINSYIAGNYYGLYLSDWYDEINKITVPAKPSIINTNYFDNTFPCAGSDFCSLLLPLPPLPPEEPPPPTP